MRAFWMALGLMAASCGGAFGDGYGVYGVASADASSDCAQQKDRDLSIRSCTLIIEGNAQGDKAIAYHRRGYAYSEKKDYDRAIADYGQAIRLKPDDATLTASLAGIYALRSLVYRHQGDYRRSLADLDEAIRLRPDLVLNYEFRGDLYYEDLGDYDRAIADYSQSIKLKPKSEHLYILRGRVCARKKDFGCAIEDFSQALRLEPVYPDYYDRGMAYYEKGDYDRAIADLNEDIRLYPKKSYNRTGRGIILGATRNSTAALEDFNEALRLKADEIRALWGRGQIYESQGLRSLAQTDYKKAIELKASDPEDKEAQNKARARLIVLEVPAAQAQAATEPRKTQAPDRRVALVIGNSAYNSVAPLPNPRNDADAVTGELTRLGFEVIEKRDLGVAAMRKALGEFEDKTAGAEWALVYYSGHGMELDGHNWLIPVDAELLRSTDVPDEAIALDRVLARLNAAGKLRIVILDACRNNPFISRMVMNLVSTRAVTRGLAPVEPTHGEVVFYAARDGNVALDGKGTNSPFAEALVKHMDEEGIELGRFFREVTSSVLASTSNQQEPFVYGRLPAERYYFRPPN